MRTDADADGFQGLALRPNRRWVGRMVAALLLYLVVGCSPLTEAPQVSDNSPASGTSSVSALPSNLKISFRWRPSATVDLMNPEATFIRAYTESYELAFEGQSAAWGYPGFESASPPGIEDQVRAIDSDSRYRDVHRTVFFQPLRRAERDGVVRMVLCRSEINSTRLRSGAVIEWKNFAQSWGIPATIDFVRSGDRVPPSEQHGQDMMPSTSVFGSWRATYFEPLGLGPENRADILACNALPPNPDLPRLGVETGPEPWPVLPPTPGWPANGL